MSISTTAPAPLAFRTPAARVRITFDHASGDQRPALATTFRCFAPLDEGDAVDLTLAIRRREPGWDVEVGPTGASHVPTPPRLRSHLVSLLNRAHLDHDPGRSHLHGGAVTAGGGAAVVLGHSGSGKSTLVADLVRRGAAYLSDEVVGLDQEGGALGYPKPVTVKSGTWPQLADLVGGLDVQDDLAEGHRWELPPDLLGAVAVADRAVPVRVTALGTWDPDLVPPIEVEPLDPVDAVLALAEHSLDLDRDPVLGLRTLSTLAARAPAFRLRHRDGDAVAAWFTEQLDRPANTPLPCRALGCGGEAGPPGAGWLRRLAPSVVLGDRAIVFVEAHRRLMALNPTATALWVGLDGRPAAELLDRTGDEPLLVAEFLAKLGDEGLVRGWTS